MKSSLTLMLAAGLFALSGCAQPAALSVADDAVLTVSPKVNQASAFKVMATVNPYAPADVLLVQVDLVKGGVVVATKDITALGSPVTFDHLRRSTAYTVNAYAFNSTTVKDATTQISVDASSTASITVGADDHPLLMSVPVQLKTRLFDGQARTASDALPMLDIATGTVSDVVATETIL